MTVEAAHDHHERLEGFDPERLLQDGCRVCEARGEDPLEALVHLDALRFQRAWERAADWQRDRLDPRRPVSAAEAPMLRTLWTMQLMFERSGISPIGMLPEPFARRVQTVLDDAGEQHSVLLLRRNANDPSSDLYGRLTMHEREAVTLACDQALPENVS